MHQPPYKIAQSVLVVIHSIGPGGHVSVLLLLRLGSEAFWQSVTGSKDFADETWWDTAVREVREETGVDALGPGCVLTDWGVENVYDIFPRWRDRYAPGVTRNTERVFGLQVPVGTPVCLNPSEHTAAQWLPRLAGADLCFSPSNAEAILMLTRRQGT